MSRLIVTRPRFGWWHDATPIYQILIDGHRAASLRPGGTAEFELPPGRHQIQSRFAWCGCPPVSFNAGTEGDHHFAVGPNRNYTKLFFFSVILAWLPLFAVILWGSPLVQRNPMSFIDSGFHLMLAPAAYLPMVPQLAFLVFLRNHRLVLKELPGDPMEGGQIARYLRTHPSRVRITVRQMMIVIGLLAVYLGASVEWTRSRRSDHLRRKVVLHSESEAIFRQLEQRWVQSTSSLEKVGLDASFTLRSAARAAARADFHAAMKSKYAEAAARRWFAVGPDPPEPPWP